jgi:protocatechuate 3,4-dioxygenase beta subunit
MKSSGAVLFLMLCAGVCAGVAAGQDAASAGATARGASETKSLVQGKVVQEPGEQGIRKVRVILSGASSQGREPFEATATTDETGQFKIEGLEARVYVVRLERPGYTADSKANRDKAMIKVVAGQDTKDLVFRMLVAGIITGKIVDADGDPLRDVSVMAVASNGGASRSYRRPSKAVPTNDLGEYRIADLPPGKYIVSAAPQRNEALAPSQGEKESGSGRLVYVTTYFPGTLDQRQAIVIEVPAGGTATANFGVLTSHAYRVSGSVSGLPAQPTPRDDTGRVVLGAMGQGIGQLLLIGNNGQAEPQSLREDGKFEFTNVLPGKYRAQVITFTGFVNGQAPPLKMLTISTPIEVNESDVVGLQLQVDRGGDVSGTFRTEGEEKIDWKQLSVSLLPVPESGEEQAGFGGISRPGFASVREDGSFEIKDVPGMNCQLAVGAHSNRFADYYTKSVLLGGQEMADTGFAVGPGTVLDVLVSAKGAAIEGTVVDEAGKPVSRATVVTVPSSGKLGRPDGYQRGVSDENGHFLLRGLNPGGFLVLAFEEMHENSRLPEFAKKYEGKGETVELEEGGRKSVALKLIKEDLEQ